MKKLTLELTVMRKCETATPIRAQKGTPKHPFLMEALTTWSVSSSLTLSSIRNAWQHTKRITMANKTMACLVSSAFCAAVVADVVLGRLVILRLLLTWKRKPLQLYYKITMSSIHISCQNWNGLFSNDSHQIMI